MEINLNGLKVMVCGSTQGIGNAVAILFAQVGAEVVLVARNKKALEAMVEELPNNGNQKHDFIVADFSHPQHLKEVVETYCKEHKIHVLVNNTGGPAAGLISEEPLEHFINAFEQHLICNHVLAQAVLPGMKELGYGRIINVISTSVKQPIPGLGVSNTVRAAVANWAKTLSREVAPFHITVNNVLPGATDTQRLDALIQSKANKFNIPTEDIALEMKKEIPMKRFARAEEIAYAVIFLASPFAAYISGINLPVDGARTMSL